MIAVFLVPFCIALVLTPFVKKVARELNIMAFPGHRHIHQNATARMGGLSIFTAFMISAMIFLRADQAILSLMIGGALIAISGMLDDLVDLSAKHKLLFQFVATAIVIFYGQIRLTYINFPGGITLEFGALSTVVTFLWIIGITNAINLVDGLDGLCAGVTSIILSTICVLAYILLREDVLLIALILLGSNLGFLFYNYHPASIFMGDTGSLFNGFIVATISLLGFKSSAFLTLGPILFLLTLPILDTFLSIVRRKIKGVSISTPDIEHIHHTLIHKMKLSHGKAVLVMYLVTFYFSQVSYIFVINKRFALYMLVVIGIIIELFIEMTGMISHNYRPILFLVDKFRSLFRRRKI